MTPQGRAAYFTLSVFQHRGRFCFSGLLAAAYRCNKSLVVFNICPSTNLRNACRHEKVSIHAGFQGSAYRTYEISYKDPE
jgi:hypothetical protein